MRIDRQRAFTRGERLALPFQYPQRDRLPVMRLRALRLKHCRLFVARQRLGVAMLQGQRVPLVQWRLDVRGREPLRMPIDLQRLIQAPQSGQRVAARDQQCRCIRTGCQRLFEIGESFGRLTHVQADPGPQVQRICIARMLCERFFTAAAGLTQLPEAQMHLAGTEQRLLQSGLKLQCAPVAGESIALPMQVAQRMAAVVVQQRKPRA